jgi:hypothetical protein
VDRDPNNPPRLSYPFEGNRKLSQKLASEPFKALRRVMQRYLPAKGKKLFTLETGYEKTGYQKLRLFLAANGTSAACAYSKGGQWFVNVNGQVYKADDGIQDVVLSPNGKRFLFITRDEQSRLRPRLSPHFSLREKFWRIFVYLDGEKIGSSSKVYDAGFSNDSQQAWVAFTDDDKKRCLVER